MKPDIKYSIDDFKKKLMDRSFNGNFQVNADMDGKFDFILPDKDFRKNIGVNYVSDVTPIDEEYDDMIVEGRPNEEEYVGD